MSQWSRTTTSGHAELADASMVDMRFALRWRSLLADTIVLKLPCVTTMRPTAVADASAIGGWLSVWQFICDVIGISIIYRRRELLRHLLHMA
jgi:hypothetical protein